MVRFELNLEASQVPISVTPLPSPLSLLLSAKDVVGCMEGWKNEGENKPANPGSLGRATVKQACVCVCVCYVKNLFLFIVVIRVN